MTTANARWDKFRSTAEQAQQEGMYEFAETSWVAALEEAEDFGDTDRRLAYTLEKLAECLWNQGKLTDAASHCKRVLKIYEKVLGKDHMDVACFAGNLAVIYHARKEYEKAEKYYKKALRIKKVKLDPESPDLKKLMGNFADLLQVTGRDDEARKLKTGAAVVTVSDWRKGTYTNPALSAEGTKDPKTSASGEAARLLKEDPVSNPMESGPESKGTEQNQRKKLITPLLPEDSHVNLPAVENAKTDTSTGIPQDGNGKLSSPSTLPTPPGAMSAPPLPPSSINKDSSEIETSAKSKEIPEKKSTLPTPPGKISQQKQVAMPEGFEFGKTSALRESTSTRADISQKSANAENAESTVAESVKSPSSSPVSSAAQTVQNHFQSWKELKEKAESALARGDLALCESTWQEALTAAESIGEDKPPLSYTLSSLGDLQARRERYDEAIVHHQRAYKIKKKVLGQNHVAVAQSANMLARLFYNLRDYNQAEPLALECVAIYEFSLGEEHPDLASALHNLATLYHVQRKYVEAEPVYKRAFTIKTKVLGSDHPETLRLLRSYADLLRSTHREAEADHFDTCATGMITGSWKAIELDEAESLVTRSDKCDICNADLDGLPKCPSCGFEAAIGVI